MIEESKNVYCSWKPSQYYKYAQVSALLFGYCGVGKSRLMNNLCGTKQKVGVARKTITQELFQGRVLLPIGQQFRLFDSPGIHKADIPGSLVLRRSLRNLDWNIIIVQTKLQTRFQDSTITQLVRLARIFTEQQLKRVVFLVSHGDILDQKSKEKEKILKDFKNSLDQYLPNKKVILFSNENSDFNRLSRILYSCAALFNSTTFNIEDKKFCRSLGYQINKDDLQIEIRENYLILMNLEPNKREQFLIRLRTINLQVYQILKHHLRKKEEIKQESKPQKEIIKNQINNHGSYFKDFRASKEKQEKTKNKINPTSQSFNPFGTIIPIAPITGINSYLYNFQNIRFKAGITLTQNLKKQT